MSLDLPNLNALYKCAEETPGDLGCYRAISDLLQIGGYASLSYAFHWMAKRNRFPHKRTHYCTGTWVVGRKVPKASRWAWYRKAVYNGHSVNGVLPKADRNLHWLPRLLLSGEQKVFCSHQSAVMFLAAQLQILKNEYDLEPRESSLSFTEQMEIAQAPTLAEILEDDT